MKIGFTGTRSGMTEPQASAVRSILLLKLCDEFHHGDCIGADAQAHDIAIDLLCYIIVHPPLSGAKRAFKRGGVIRATKPYLERNKDIVRETEAIVAAPGESEEQLRSGTWSTVRFARKLGRPLWIVMPDGAVVDGV